MIIHFLRIIRWPNLLIIAFTQFLVAITLVQGVTFDNIWQDSSFLALVASTVLIAAGGYLINDYYDTKIDLVIWDQLGAIHLGEHRHIQSDKYIG